MDFRQLQSFVAVVDYRSFSRAAEKLHSAQPTISTHVRTLEEELNTRLILRTTKTIEVTTQGWEAYRYAKIILDMRDRILESCTAASRNIIRVGASTIPATYILPDILSNYAARSPETYFVINQVDSKAVIEGVQDGHYDVGMCSMSLEREGVVCVPFCTSRQVLITPVTEEYLQLQSRVKVPIEKLLKQPIVLREKGSRKYADQFLERMGINEEDLNVVARVNDQETVKNMVAKGVGVSLISEIAARDFIRGRRLLKFELPEQDTTQQLYLVYRDKFGTQPVIERFINFASQYEVR